MTLNRLLLSASALLLATALLPSQAAAAAPPQQGWGQDRGWEAPPREFSEIQQRGFRDGVNGARKDIENNRRPDVNNRDEYREPNLPRELREPYREGFRRGYETAMARLNTPQPEHREPERGGWESWSMRGLGSEMQRRGYQEGADGARKDIENHRRPDPNNRDEYRQPRVPREFWDEYQQGFRRGYEVTISQLAGESAWQGGGQWTPSPRFSEIQQRGFRDGADGARKDVENHRRPDPNNRDEYRQPRVPQQLWDEYREGFRRGYEVTVTQIYGESNPR